MGLETLRSQAAAALLTWGTVLAAAPPARADGAQCTGAAAVDRERELFITNPAVVADARAEPGGPWHFSTLIKRMLPAGATDKDASDFLRAWLGTWDAEQRLTPDPTKPAGPDNPQRILAKRPAVTAKLAGAWLDASKQARLAAGEPEDGTLRLALAPFALRAIVYRPDRRDRTHCKTSAGEGRFLFAALAAPTDHPTAVPLESVLQMTMIFEYDLPATSLDAQGWARNWHALGTELCADAAGCEAYRAKLAALTDSFASGGLLPGRPAGNPLAQLRTNEIIAFPSELRQFELVEATPGHHALVNSPVAQTPDLSVNNSAALGAWALANRAAILAETHVMPPALIGFSAPAPRATTWKLPASAGLTPEEAEALRFKLSKNTCSGCHAFEHGQVPDVDGLWQFAPDGRISGFLTEQDLPARQAEVCGLIDLAVCKDDGTPPLPRDRGRAH